MTTSSTFHFLTLTLLLASTKCGVIIQSDGIGEVLQGPEQVTISNFNYGSLLKMSYDGAKVIWGANWNSESDRATKTFIETFKVWCKEPIFIYIGADNAFEVFINGYSILQGNDISKVYRKEIPRNRLNFCEKNVLKVVATNYQDYSQAGVIYQLTSDQNCLQCEIGGHFNQ